MITINHYLASKDTRRFNKKQTIAEQYEALGTLDYRYDLLLGEGGQLIDLREAILNSGEKIPGRTSDESLKMVNAVITSTQKWIAYDADRRFKRTLKLLGMVALTFFILVATPFFFNFMTQVMPHLIKR